MALALPALGGRGTTARAFSPRLSSSVDTQVTRDRPGMCHRQPVAVGRARPGCCVTPEADLSVAVPFLSRAWLHLAFHCPWTGAAAEEARMPLPS